MKTLEVLLIDTNKIHIDELLKSSFLTNKDLEVLSRYKDINAKKEKVASFILKNKYIGEYSLNECGKPISENCFFNIAHSHGVVVFVKDIVPIGIDIEKIRPIKQDLIEFISSFEEKEYIKDEKTFFEIWTSKEAISKAIGTGLKGDIKDIPSLPINCVKHYLNKDYFVKTILHDEYVISIARESDEEFEIIIK